MSWQLQELVLFNFFYKQLRCLFCKGKELPGSNCRQKVLKKLFSITVLDVFCKPKTALFKITPVDIIYKV